MAGHPPGKESIEPNGDREQSCGPLDEFYTGSKNELPMKGVFRADGYSELKYPCAFQRNLDFIKQGFPSRDFP